jgi:hypothetical protein
MAMPGDVALVLDGAEQTHASLLAQAESAGSGSSSARRRVWSTTAADGSVESILWLLASWRAGAEIVAVEQSPHEVGQLELLHRFQPAVVWFSDDEYGALAAMATAEPAWANLGSIRQALASVEGTDAPAAFGHVFGVGIALASAGPLAGLAEAKRRRCRRACGRGSRSAAQGGATRGRTPRGKLARRREKEEAKELRKAEEQRRRDKKRTKRSEKAEREAGNRSSRSAPPRRSNKARGARSVRPKSNTATTKRNASAPKVERAAAGPKRAAATV